MCLWARGKWWKAASAAEVSGEDLKMQSFLGWSIEPLLIDFSGFFTYVVALSVTGIANIFAHPSLLPSLSKKL